MFGDVMYFIGAEIGKGAFGTVYECTDTWGNELAAKVLSPRNQPYDVIKDNWSREFNNLLMLRHPFVTHIFAAFEYRDTFYIITERCHRTLDDLLQEPKYDGNIWVIPVARCLLQAVGFLHLAGVVHKDIHSGNVMMSIVKDELIPDQHAAIKFKLGDLGISRFVADIDIFNATLAQWMLPPEHLNPNEFGNLDQRVDIYHCALLLMQVLVGKKLDFTREEILEGEPRRIAERLPPPYSFALSKALRRHVANRTGTAAELWRDLNTSASPQH